MKNYVIKTFTQHHIRFNLASEPYPQGTLPTHGGKSTEVLESKLRTNGVVTTRIASIWGRWPSDQSTNEATPSR